MKIDERPNDALARSPNAGTPRAVVSGAASAVLVALVTAFAGCQPQQTDIVTEIHQPDGTIVRYVNKSSGYGYNPNLTGSVQANAVVDGAGAVVTPAVPIGWGRWWGASPWYGGGGWGAGCLNPWAYNPGVAWQGGVFPANPCRPFWP